MKPRFAIFALLVLAMLFTACTPVATPTAAPAAEEPTAAPTEAMAAEATEAPAAEEPAAGGEPEACASDSFGCAKFASGETIKIGMGAPMTGDNANFGIDISQGAQIAAIDGGEISGVKFELVTEDDGGTPEGGAAVANKLVSDPAVVAIAGHIFSGATEAAMPIYEKAGLPMLSPSATNPPLTQKGSAVFNRIAFTDATQAKFAAEYLYNDLGIKKLGILHDGQAYGLGLAEGVQTNFTALGGEVVGFEAVTPGESDYSAILAAVGAKAPEALYFGGYIQEGVIIANQMKTTGLENAIFFGCDGTYGQDFLDRTAANGEGAYAVSLVPPESEVKAAFDAAYTEKFGAAPGTLSPFTWNGYDVAAALISAIKSVAITADDGSVYIPRGALVAAVRGLTDYQGLTGTITCDETGECNATGPIFYIIKDGAWVAAASAK